MPQPGSRLEQLRTILESGMVSSQDDIAREMKRRGFKVTQSTISRSLRKLGAFKSSDESGNTIYRLPQASSLPPPVQASLVDLVLSIQSNSSLIVIHTAPGSASLVARHIDHYRPAGIIGTIAGEDAIFVAPSAQHSIAATILAIRKSLESG